MYVQKKKTVHIRSPKQMRGTTLSLWPLPPRWLLPPWPRDRRHEPFPQLTLRWERTWAQSTGSCCLDSFYSSAAYQHSNFPGKQIFVPQSKNCCSQMHLKLWIPFHSFKGGTQLVVFDDLLLWGYFKVMNRSVSYYGLCYMDVGGNHGIGEGWQVSKSTVNAQCRKG